MRRGHRDRGGVTAEESAQDAARRIREDAERRARRTSVSGAPASAARPTSAALASLPPGWSTLPPRRRRDPGPGEPDPPARHVSVGPGGVFAITTPAGPGPGDATAAIGWAGTVRAGAGPAAPHVVAVLCTTTADGQVPGRVPGQVPGDVPGVPGAEGLMVCSPEGLRRLLTSSPVVLTPSEVAAAALRLEAVGRRGAGSAAVGRPAAGPLGALGMAGRVLIVALVALLLLGLALAGSRISTRLGGPADGSTGTRSEAPRSAAGPPAVVPG